MNKIKEFIINNKKIVIIIVAVILAAVIVAGILIGTRGGKSKTGGTEAGTTTEDVKEEETTTEDETTQEEETTTEEEQKAPYINPLTGEASEIDYAGKRPVAVMLNTIKQALPQSGNSKADILIEMTEEGGITRILGIYQDLDGVGTIGPVRSTREYYYSWTQGFDSIMVHAGGDSWVLDQIRKDGSLTIDSIMRNRGAFWRDADRLAYLSMEHTLFTSSEKLQGWLNGSEIPVTNTKSDITKLDFIEKLPDDYMTAGANNIKVAFSGYKSTSFKFNDKTGKYDVFFWDNEPYMDDASKTQVDVTNIIILPVPNWTAPDAWGKVRQKYNLSGGKGYYINNGEYMEINWTKGDYNVVSEYGNSLKMTTTAGKPLTLAVGKTYICVVNETFAIDIAE